ncbi:MAG: hypothetical protein ACKOTB_14225 [Planctomycetia bacterium]
MAAVLFQRLGEPRGAEYFTRMAVASHGGDPVEQFRQRGEALLSDGRQRVGGLDPKPEIRVSERSAESRHGGRGTAPQFLERMARSDAGVERVRIEQCDDGRQRRVRPRGERVGGTLPHDGRPGSEPLEQFRVGKLAKGGRAVLVRPPATVRDE